MFQKIDFNKPSSPVDIPLLSNEYAKVGLPCRSTILPSKISNLPQIKDRKSQVNISFCKMWCPAKNIPEQVPDKEVKKFFDNLYKENVLFAARKSVIGVEGRHVIMGCLR